MLIGLCLPVFKTKIFLNQMTLGQGVCRTFSKYQKGKMVAVMHTSQDYTYSPRVWWLLHSQKDWMTLLKSLERYNYQNFLHNKSRVPPQIRVITPRNSSDFL